MKKQSGVALITAVLVVALASIVAAAMLSASNLAVHRASITHVLRGLARGLSGHPERIALASGWRAARAMPRLASAAPMGLCHSAIR